MTNPAESPNIDPTNNQKEVLFTNEQFQFLGDFSNALRNTYRYTENGTGGLNQEEEDSFQTSISRIVEDGFNQSRAQNGPGSETLKLAVAAEGLGVTFNGNLATDLLDELRQNVLLNDDDKSMLADLSDSSIASRYAGVNPNEIIHNTLKRTSSMLDQIARSEQKGIKRDALKIAILAFSAGITVRSTSYDKGEDLLMESQNYIKKPTEI